MSNVESKLGRNIRKSSRTGGAVVFFVGALIGGIAEKLETDNNQINMCLIIKRLQRAGQRIKHFGKSYRWRNTVFCGLWCWLLGSGGFPGMYAKAEIRA